MWPTILVAVLAFALGVMAGFLWWGIRGRHLHAREQQVIRADAEAVRQAHQRQWEQLRSELAELALPSPTAPVEERDEASRKLADFAERLLGRTVSPHELPRTPRETT